jgi:hypothetical protein
MEIKDIRSAKISCINRIIILLSKYDYSIFSPEDKVILRILNDSKKQFLAGLVPPQKWDEPDYDLKDLYMLEKIINRTATFEELVSYKKHKEELIRKYCELNLKYKLY